MAKGVVFLDANNNRKWDQDEKPIPGVRVSNGVKIVTTDEKGAYSLPVNNDSIIFVIKPSGYRTPLSKENLPQFYYIHKPDGSPKQKYPGVAPTGKLPESVDFPLYRQSEPSTFKAIMFGDPQPRNQKEVDYIAHDVVEELVGTDAALGVTLGDIMFDDLSLFGPNNRMIALMGIPWYNVIGNHDINYDARNRKEVNETFERNFGPSYYSFDYGSTHFIVLDNINWVLNNSTGKFGYRGGFGEEQLEFVKADLNLIPKDQFVCLMMHIPIVGVDDKSALYQLIEDRPLTISISGHTHHHEHAIIGTKQRQIIKHDVAKGNAKCGIGPNQLLNHIMGNVIDFLLVSWLRITKHNGFERRWFGLAIEREVNRFRQFPRRCNPRIFLFWRAVRFVNVIKLRQILFR